MEEGRKFMAYMGFQKTGLFTDLYQLTMAYGYWKSGRGNDKAAFNLFFRERPFGGAYAVCCGLGVAINYIENFGFSEEDLNYLASLKGRRGRYLFDKAFLEYLSGLSLQCDINAIPEGQVVFPLEPLLQVRGPLIQCQLLETMLLNVINFQTLIATKAARICSVAEGPVFEFGMRRAQGTDGALSASRAAYIGGCSGTSHVMAGKIFDIPVKGTHAHSWVMAFDSEKEAFTQYTASMPDNSVLLVDTYDTIEGVKTAAESGLEMKSRGQKLLGIRLDSGNLNELSRKARKILDDHNLEDCLIVASGDLDEHVIKRLKREGAQIDVWGVGTRLATGKGQGALDGVYKMSALKKEGKKWLPKMKLSDDPLKSTYGGLHQIRRFLKNGSLWGDMIYDEHLGPGNKMECENNIVAIPASLKSKDLLEPIFIGGKRIYTVPDIHTARQSTTANLHCLTPELLKLKTTKHYPVGLEYKLAQLNRKIADNITKHPRRN
jgi:nicotinate phosphoribosyltransferase